MRKEKIQKEKDGAYKEAVRNMRNTHQHEQKVTALFNALEDIYLRLLDSPRQALSTILRDYKVNPNILPVMQKVGIVSYEGTNKRDLAWTWLGDAPTLQLAEEIWDTFTGHIKMTINKRLGNKVEAKRVERDAKKKKIIPLAEMTNPDIDNKPLKIKVAKMFARLEEYQMAYEILLTIAEDR